MDSGLNYGVFEEVLKDYIPKKINAKSEDEQMCNFFLEKIKEKKNEILSKNLVVPISKIEKKEEVKTNKDKTIHSEQKYDESDYETSDSEAYEKLFSK